jgi:hypothetical protein
MAGSSKRKSNREPLGSLSTNETNPEAQVDEEDEDETFKAPREGKKKWGWKKRVRLIGQFRSGFSNNSIGFRFKAGLEARLGRCPKRQGKTCFPHVRASPTIR